MSKTKLTNVRGVSENDDPFYRYKMEEVLIAKEGVKFSFLNIENICLALNRNPSELVSFLQKHFGAQFELKNGKVLTSKSDLNKLVLQNAIYKFIEHNVLCKTCKNPETKKIVEKKKTFLVCDACSAKTDL